MKEAIKASEKLLKASDSRSEALMKRLQKLESKSGGPSGGGETKSKQCFICGGDHLARNCPSKKGKDKDHPIDPEEEA